MVMVISSRSYLHRCSQMFVFLRHCHHHMVIPSGFFLHRCPKFEGNGLTYPAHGPSTHRLPTTRRGQCHGSVAHGCAARHSLHANHCKLYMRDTGYRRFDESGEGNTEVYGCDSCLTKPNAKKSLTHETSTTFALWQTEMITLHVLENAQLQLCAQRSF